MRSILLFRVLPFLFHRWAQCLVCGRGKLGRWFRELGLGFREQPSPGPEAGRRRTGAAGEAVAE